VEPALIDWGGGVTIYGEFQLLSLRCIGAVGLL